MQTHQDCSHDEDEYKTWSKYSDDDDDVGEANDTETRPVSQFKNYWEEKIANVHIETNYSRGSNPGLNTKFVNFMKILYLIFSDIYKL